MRLIVQFLERTGISISDLSELAGPKLVAFTFDITEPAGDCCNPDEP